MSGSLTPQNIDLSSCITLYHYESCGQLTDTSLSQIIIIIIIII